MASQQDKLKAHLKVAQAYAGLSTARRLKVGAVLVKDDRPVSVGYNGTPSGYDNVCELYINGQLETKPEAIHAEANVIAFAAKNGVSTDGCIMVITDSPCFECSKLIVQSGINAVYYQTEYRITDSLKFLEENNVLVQKIDL